MLDLTVVGNLLLDEVHGIDSPPLLEPGGAALFTALAARRAGAEVGVHSVVGLDYPIDLLAGAGVRLNLHTIDGPGGRTVIRYTEQGRQLAHLGPGHQEMTPQLPHPFQTRLVHLAPMPWSWQVFHLKNCEPRTALLDPYPTLNKDRYQQILPLLGNLRFLVVNTEELEMELDEIDPELPVLVKQGPDGGYCRQSGQRWKALDTKVVDPTGAGDSFVGGLSAGLAAGLDLPESLMLGAEMAALVISANGARAFLRDL